jgi:hypothetical protein
MKIPTFIFLVQRRKSSSASFFRLADAYAQRSQLQTFSSESPGGPPSIEVRQQILRLVSSGQFPFERGPSISAASCG